MLAGGAPWGVKSTDCDVPVTRETRFIIVFTLGFVALGLWQHLYFSRLVGEFVFFKNAFDEDTYTLFPFGTAGVRADRLFSGAIVSLLLWLSHGSCNFTLIAMDALFPPLVFLAAYFAGAAIFAKFPARCLFALILVFAPDLFSLGSTASYPGPFPTLYQFRALVGEAFVPPMETSYLGLYRSPEPQVSYVVGFVFIGLLLRTMFRSGQKMSLPETAGLVAVQALLMMCYALITYPLLLIEGFAATMLFVAGRRQKAAILAALFLTSVIAALVFTRITLGPSSTALFSSRLPVVTVGAIFALALTVSFLGLLLRGGRPDPRLMIGIAFAGLPLALTNQQIFTGVMVSVRDWERHIDLALVVVAAGILVSYMRWRPRWQNPATALATIAVAGFVAMSSVRTYELWLPDNLKSLAIARAITAAGASLDPDTLLVLDQPEFAPLVEARLGRPLHALLNYTEVFRDPTPPTPDFRMTSLSESLFEYWKQLGVAPSAARETLEQEARQRNGYYSGFLFNTCEYWSPCTDGRAVKTQKIVSEIPAVIASYTTFLANRAPARKFAFVTSKSPPDPPKGVKIGEGGAASVTALVYLRN
jgi:hypothetical protein